MIDSTCSRRRWLRSVAAIPLWPTGSVLTGCGGGGTEDGAAPAEQSTSTAQRVNTGARSSTTTSSPSTRRWRQGFGGVPPRADVSTAIDGIRLWSQRAELAVIHEETPWQSLLNGADPMALVQAEKLPLATFYRSLGLKLMVVTELNDGLARELDAPQLRAMGRSLTEPAVQQVWRAWVLAVARVLQPDWLCLAAETNLVRAIAPAPLYRAVVAAANAAAADLQAATLEVRPVLLTSVQVEAAWGRLPGMDGSFRGIETDRSDFAFSELQGLSSYPYLGFDHPEDMPDTYYSRLLSRGRLRPMVTECGWSSAPVAGRAGTPQDQAAYQAHHAALLDAADAVAVVQLLYADLDLVSMGIAAAPNLPLFASIGLTDMQFGAKPALAAWDALHARALA